MLVDVRFHSLRVRSLHLLQKIRIFPVSRSEKQARASQARTPLDGNGSSPRSLQSRPRPLKTFGALR